MIYTTLNNKQYSVPNQWSDITLMQAIKMSKIELHEVVDSSDWFKHMEVVKEHFKILTDIPVDSTKPSSLVHIFVKYMLPFAKDLRSVAPESYKPELIDSFKHGKQVYLMPDNLEIGENLILQHGQNVRSFIEASNLLKQFATLKSDGINAMPSLVASVVKIDRLEDFNEKEISRRAKSFESLPMDIVWEVFFCLSQLIIRCGRDTLKFMNRKETKVQRLIQRLDTRLGRLLLQRAELVGQLKGLTK